VRALTNLVARGAERLARRYWVLVLRKRGGWGRWGLHHRVGRKMVPPFLKIKVLRYWHGGVNTTLGQTTAKMWLSSVNAHCSGLIKRPLRHTQNGM
jgi:hypothetical protein